MKESKGDIRFGIFLKEDNFRLVEIENSQDHQHRINKIIQAKTDIAFDLNSINNDQQVIQIGEQIKDIVEVFHLQVRNAVFAMECPFALIKKIPIDANFSQGDVIDQIDWEVEKFSYSPDDEYIVDFQKLEKTVTAGVQQMVVVAVREKIIQQLRKMFRAARLSVNVIDVDIFSAARALEANYELKADETIALTDIDENGIKITIIKDKEFYHYRELAGGKLQVERASLKFADENEIVNILSKELKSLVVDVDIGDSVESLQRIFLYGNYVKDGFLENMQNSFNVRIDKINPFRKLYIAPKVSVDEKIWSHPEMFTICVGSALHQ